MMYGPQKSDPCIVAEKPSNKPGQPGAETAERRQGAEGNAVTLANVPDPPFFPMTAVVDFAKTVTVPLVNAETRARKSAMPATLH